MSFRVHAALTTPFDRRGRVDLDALRSHIELLADDGVDGIVPAGTTGEGPLLDEDEVVSVLTTAAEAAARRMEVIAHVGRASTPATVRLARAAVAAGADAVMAITPYYYAHAPAALLTHYRALLAAADATPALAYTFPARTGNELPAALLDALAGEGLAGLKDSTRSRERHAEYLDVASHHRGFRVFVGSERLGLDSLRGGGAGAISGLANVRADLLLRLRDERSERAQETVDGARAELTGISELKRALRARLAEHGVEYPDALRPPLEG